MKKHKFKIGQRVRRSKRWWPKEEPWFYGKIVSQLVGIDNCGRRKLAYVVRWERRKKDWEGVQINDFEFLEIELEEVE